VCLVAALTHEFKRQCCKTIQNIVHSAIQSAATASAVVPTWDGAISLTDPSGKIRGMAVARMAKNIIAKLGNTSTRMMN